MAINLTKRLEKGPINDPHARITAAEYDADLTSIEDAVNSMVDAAERTVWGRALGAGTGPAGFQDSTALRNIIGNYTDTARGLVPNSETVDHSQILWDDGWGPAPDGLAIGELALLDEADLPGTSADFRGSGVELMSQAFAGVLSHTHDADDVTFDPGASSLSSADVGAALRELDGLIDDVEINPTDPTIVTITGTTYTLAAAERDNLFVKLRISNADANSVIVIPESAAANDAWNLDSGSTGTATIIAAEGVSWQEPVEDNDLTAPPGSPATGDRYIVATGGTGAWAAHDDEIAEWDGAAWDFTSPVDGMTTWVKDEKLKYERAAGAWASFVGSALINGAQYVEVAGAGRVAHVWCLSNAGNVPICRAKGDTTEATTSDADHNQADKVLSRPELKDYSETSTTPASAAGVLTLNCENGNIFQTALTENVTSVVFSNPPATGKAGSVVLKITQDSTPRTITWPASVKWPGGVAPTLSTGSGDVDIFTFITFDGGTTWYGFIGGQDFS